MLAGLLALFSPVQILQVALSVHIWANMMYKPLFLLHLQKYDGHYLIKTIFLVKIIFSPQAYVKFYKNSHLFGYGGGLFYTLVNASIILTTVLYLMFCIYLHKSPTSHIRYRVHKKQEHNLSCSHLLSRTGVQGWTVLECLSFQIYLSALFRTSGGL